MKKFSLAIIIAFLSLSSCYKQDIIHVNEVDTLTPIRKSLGITGYNKIDKNGDNIRFNLQAEASYVNGASLNLNNSSVFIENKSQEYQLTLTYPDKTTGRLVFNKNTSSILYFVNEKIKFEKHLTSDSGKEMIKPDEVIHSEVEVIFLMSLLSDPYLKKDLDKKNITFIDFSQSNMSHSSGFEISKREDDEGDACVGVEPYYGYTIGWGYTQAASEDHENRVRRESENIAKYRCNSIGTDTSCLTDSHICVTTTTFTCCGSNVIAKL